MSLKLLLFIFTCSPALLRIVLLKLFCLSFVDDALLTAPNFKHAKHLLNQSFELFRLAKMVVHKMNTNYSKFKLYLKERVLLDKSVTLFNTLQSITKAFGLCLDPDNGKFRFNPNEIVLAVFNHRTITERTISRYSSIALCLRHGRLLKSNVHRKC